MIPLFFWWLRSPGNNDNNAAYVNVNGNVNNNGNNVNNNKYGVRPASPYRPMSVESSSDLRGSKDLLCIRQRNPVPFRDR